MKFYNCKFFILLIYFYSCQLKIKKTYIEENIQSVGGNLRFGLLWSYWSACGICWWNCWLGGLKLCLVDSFQLLILLLVLFLNFAFEFYRLFLYFLSLCGKTWMGLFNLFQFSDQISLIDALICNTQMCDARTISLCVADFSIGIIGLLQYFNA